MLDQTVPPPLAEAADTLTTQLVLAELRMHHWVAGPFAWLDATVLAKHTPITHIGPRQAAIDAALEQLQHTGHVQLTHLPPRIPPHNAATDHRTHDADMITLHARLELAPHHTYQEHAHHTASLCTIATRLRHLLHEDAPDTNAPPHHSTVKAVPTAAAPTPLRPQRAS